MTVDENMQHEVNHSFERQMHKFDTAILSLAKDLEDLKKLVGQHSLYIDNMQNTHDDVDQIPRELLRSNNTGGGV